MALSTNTVVIARLAAGMYGMQLGWNTMGAAVNDAAGTDVGLKTLMNTLYGRDFAFASDADVASALVANLGITGADAASAASYVEGQLGAAAAGQKGAAVVDLVNLFAGLTADPMWGGYATAFNTQIDRAVAYAGTNPTDVMVSAVVPTFTLNAATAAGADVMRLTGNMDAVIDFTNPANQVTGLDLNGNGVVEINGIENVSSHFSAAQRGADFEIVDAYPRNPLNHLDTANNFLGDIVFKGEGFNGDGVNTNGNIFLGGLGTDNAKTGDGNDFLAGGGIAQGRVGMDVLSGGRNADFFFGQFAAGQAADGTSLDIDGGITADDNSAGTTQSAQDNDWLLLEATDDDEPVRVWMNDDNIGDNTDAADGLFDGKGRVLSRSGQSMTIDDVENLDASGNLYGFLNNMDVKLGARAGDSRDAGAGNAGGANNGYGSSAQLDIRGSDVANIIIGGYDNDHINGRDGNDLLMGGNLNFRINPNLAGIWNNGRDELIGGAGDDDIVFETDGGVYEGGATVNVDDAATDTLWLTKDAFGTRTAADVTSDSTVRMDLAAGKVGGLANAAGYGGADKAAATGNYTSDQSNYNAGYDRAQVQDFENVIATGLGSVDYLAAGTNNPELLFANQQNHLAFVGNLDLRGTDGANVLYAVGGNDVIEGRRGDDSLSGGDGNDDFYFAIAGDGSQDGVDVIHRQTDANGDNLWDTDATGAGLFERDFNIGGTSTKGASALTVDLGTTDLSSPDVAMTSFSIKIDGATFAVTDAAALSAAMSAAEVATLVNTAYHAIDAKVSAVAVGNTIVVTDTDGRDISDTVSEGYAVGGVVSNGAFSAQAIFAPAGTSTTKDRLIYKSYEDRADNEGADDDSVLGSTISLGSTGYAEDLVINFADEDGNGAATTRIAEGQRYTVTFTNLTTQDKVTVAVNGVNYSLQVGVDLDGNIIANEDTATPTSQAAILTNFVARLNGFINSFMDDDTSAGAVNSAVAGSTLTLTQRAYNGEETVFMTKPVVTLGNESGGEKAKATVANVSNHEVELLDFDGRNGELNDTNVLFIGETGISRANLRTAKDAGETINGTEAVLIDGGPDDLQSTVFGTTTTIFNNTSTNSPLAGLNFSAHGDDFLLGGNGNDIINAGTGDDRVEGSTGTDAIDGGKNFYAVKVLGEAQSRVYVLNKWEAANPSKVTALSGLTISSLTLIQQTETGTGLTSGVFDDTLQFSQARFTAGTSRFTVTLNDFTVTGGVVELRNDGAGTVGVDTDGNGTIDHTTTFKNFENIRTVSGTGNAVAGDGQGNDTLNVSALSSSTTGADGILYNLTNDALGGSGGDPGSVMYSANAHASLTRPAATDFESLVIKVDGVESVIGGTGDDLLLIDETEAAKNNTFTGDLGDDRIEYQNAFAGEATPGVAEPTVTIKVDNTPASLGGTDTVTMTGGRVGTTVATDTLNGVEFITLAGRTAAGTRENDVLDVTAMTAGAIVSYVDGTVRDLAGTKHLTVEGIVQIENIWADGNDTVIVADASVMSGNQRQDTANGTPSVDLALPTFIDFDTLKNPGVDNARKAFLSQSSAEIENVVNQNQFTFNLSKTGTGADSDTVDYSNANDNIAVVVELDAAKPNQYVLVDGDGATFFSGPGDLTDSVSRVDQLISVERVVASQGESVLDLTGSTKGLEIKFNQAAASDRVAGNATTNAYDVSSVRISDLTTASPLSRSYIEYRDAAADPLAPDVVGATNKPTATWNRIEGSDNAETVIASSAHSFDNDTFNLRGGVNAVKYNELTKSITLTLSVTDFLASNALGTGTVNGTVQFQDGTGAGVEGPYLAGSGTHMISSYTANNGIASGSLRVAASQDAEDTLKFAGLSEKLFLLAETGTTDNQITVKIGTGAAQNSVILTGFELVSDSASDDVYDFGSFANAVAGLNFVDNPADHDTVKVDGTVTTVLATPTNINLASINALVTLAPLGFDFDVLDVTKINDVLVTSVTGVVAGEGTDEVVFGKLNNIASALEFESVVLTEATIGENGTTYVMDTTANTLVAGAKSLALTNGANTVSFGGLVLENTSPMRAATSLTATSGVTVTTVGVEAVNFTGGNGADSLHGGAGNDTLRGGGGNDTLNGNFVPEAVEVHTYTFSSPAGGAGETIIIDGFTVTEGATIQGVVVANNDADAMGAAFVREWNANPTSFTNNASIQSLTYDALTNALTFTFTSVAGDVLDTLLGAPGGTAAASVSGETVSTPYAARGESADTYVFEATAALNGQDTILNFDATDTLNFTNFFAVSGWDAFNTTANLGVAQNLTGFNDWIVSGYNKATLAAGDFGAGKIELADGGSAVFITTGDSDNVADTTNDGYKVYFVNDVDPGPGITYQVDLVGSFTPNTELLTTQINFVG